MNYLVSFETQRKIIVQKYRKVSLCLVLVKNFVCYHKYISSTTFFISPRSGFGLCHYEDINELQVLTDHISPMPDHQKLIKLKNDILPFVNGANVYIVKRI